MKAAWMVLIALVSVAPAAKAESTIKTAEYSVFEGWPGEYPSGYQILEDIEVTTVITPENPFLSRVCSLKKDMVIHPWAKKTHSQFVSLSGVARYTAKRDFTIWKSEAEVIEVKTGQEVQQLSYLSEGFCLIQAGGQVGEDACLTEDDDRVTPLSMSPFGLMLYFRTTCSEGYQSWISDRELMNLITGEDDQTVKPAVIANYGEVEEP